MRVGETMRRDRDNVADRVVKLLLIETEDIMGTEEFRRCVSSSICRRSLALMIREIISDYIRNYYIFIGRNFIVEWILVM